MKKFGIFKTKLTRLEEGEKVPTLKEIRESKNLSKIFNLLVLDRLSVNEEGWLDIGESAFQNLEELDPEVNKKIAKLELREKTYKAYSRAKAFADFIKHDRYKKVVSKVAAKSHFGLGALYRNLGEDGLMEYLRNENNCIAVAVSNPKVLDRIIKATMNLREMEEKSRQANLDFKNSVLGLAKIGFGETKKSAGAAGKDALLFFSVWSDWIKGKSEQEKIKARNRREAGEVGEEAKEQKFEELREQAGREREEELKRAAAKLAAEAYEKAQAEESFGEGDMFVSSAGEVKGFKKIFSSVQSQARFVGDWFGREIKKISEDLEAFSEDYAFKKEAGAYGKQKQEEEIEKLRQGSEAEFAKASIWADHSFSDVLEMRASHFESLKAVWKESFLNLFKSEKWKKLGKDISGLPKAALRSMVKLNPRLFLSKSAGKDFGREPRLVEEKLKVDLSAELPSYDELVGERRKIEKRLFVSFNEEKKEPGIVDQVKNKINQKDWLEFIDQPGRRKIKQMIDEIRKHRGEKFLTNKYFSSLLKNFRKMELDPEMQKLGGSSIMLGKSLNPANWNYTPKQVENFLLDELRKMNLRRWTDHCLRQSGVAIGARGDVWRVLSIMTLKKRVEKELEPFVEALSY